MTNPDKVVLCWRCLRSYNLRNAKYVKVKGLQNKQPVCPLCGCGVYV